MVVWTILHHFGPAHFLTVPQSLPNKHFGRDGARDKQEPCLGQTGPVPGDKPGPWDKTGRFQNLLNSTATSPFVPFVPGTVGGSSPRTMAPQGLAEKCLCVLCLLVLSPPPPHQRVSRTCFKRHIGEDFLGMSLFSLSLTPAQHIFSGPNWGLFLYQRVPH